MDAIRVCVVSDTHLSASAVEAQGNWDAVVRHVAKDLPDLVIHVGDLCLDGTDGGDLDHARRQLDRLAVPWSAVPGNHDIGDNPWPGAAAGAIVSAARRQRWVDTIGADFWTVTLGEWRVVAVNAQLFGSDLEEETDQWAWLQDCLDPSTGPGPVALISHKPLAAPASELASAPRYRFVPRPSRRRLAAMTGAHPVELVVSGHVHQHRVLDLDSTRHIWAPTTWAVLPDDTQPRVGTKRCGLMTLELGDGRPVEPEMVEPDGIDQLMLGRDLADPYRH